MPQVQVKKVVAICFLEAVKQALEQLCAFRVELSQHGAPGPANLPSLYGETRRLRDYFQRSVGAYQDNVTLDLSAEDAGLLVACCRRAIESIDLRVAEQMIGAEEKQYLQRKRQVLADWAVELAEKPLIELPLKRQGAATDGSRALMARLHQKLFGNVSQRTRIVAPSSGHHGMATGVQMFDPQPGTPGASPPEALQTKDWQTIQGAAEEPLPGTTKSASVPASSTGVGADAAAGPCLIDSAKVRDPRLRSLVALDLRSYERAIATADHRLAAILLASLAESAVIDHAIPRRAEFGLTGTPETWDPVELLLRALGEAAEPKDRALAFNLFASRNLLRPAMQMVTPAVVTAATLERLQVMVQRLLHGLGFAGTHAAAPETYMNLMAPETPES